MPRATFLFVAAASVTAAMAVGAAAFAAAIMPVNEQGVVQDVAPIVVPKDSPVTGDDGSGLESPADPAAPQGPETPPTASTPSDADAPEVVVPSGAEELPPTDGAGNDDGNNGAGVGNGGGNGTGNEGNGVGPGNDNGGGNDTPGTEEVEP